MIFYGRISPRLTGNRIEKKRDDIFKIKCNDTTIPSWLSTIITIIFPTRHIA